MPPTLPTDPACIFCKIAAGTIPSHKIYEDDAVFAFLDISPIVRGHTLVIPKSHHATLMETPPEILAAVNQRLRAISRAVLAATGAPACHLLLNSGAEAMQTVKHIHFHILPRREDDGFSIPWPSKSLAPADAAALANAVRQALDTAS